MLKIGVMPNHIKGLAIRRHLPTAGFRLKGRAPQPAKEARQWELSAIAERRCSHRQIGLTHLGNWQAT